MPPQYKAEVFGLRPIPYFITAAALAMLLCPIRFRVAAKQRGFSVRLMLSIDLLFGLVRLPLRFLIKFNAERFIENRFRLKEAFSIFRLTRGGKRKRVERTKPKKPKGERLPLRPVLGAFSLKKLVLRAQIALDDAASCVLVCGELNCAVQPLLSLAAELSPVEARKAVTKAEFLPKFGENSVFTAFEGILETYPAKLIWGSFSALTKKHAKKRAESGQASQNSAKNRKKTKREKERTDAPH